MPEITISLITKLIMRDKTNYKLEKVKIFSRNKGDSDQNK